MTLWHFGTFQNMEYAVIQALMTESAKVSKCHGKLLSNDI